MSSNFKVCSYNIGQVNGKAYRKLLRYKESPLTEDTTEIFDKKYKETEEKVASLLSEKADAFFLQEVGLESRPFIKTLQLSSFSIIHFDWKGDTPFRLAIALNNNSFSKIENHSMVKQFNDDTFEIAIATAKEKETGQKILFISAHCLSKKESTSDDTAQKYYSFVAKQASIHSDCNVSLIGADMKDSFERDKKRFIEFQNEGFSILRQNSPTKVNTLDTSKKSTVKPFDFFLTETDYIFAKMQPYYLTAASSLLFETQQNEATILQKKREPITFDPENNTSNHLPIFAQITTKKVESQASSAITSFSKYLGDVLSSAREGY